MKGAEEAWQTGKGAASHWLAHQELRKVPLAAVNLAATIISLSSDLEALRGQPGSDGLPGPWLLAGHVGSGAGADWVRLLIHVAGFSGHSLHVSSACNCVSSGLQVCVPERA